MKKTIRIISIILAWVAVLLLGFGIYKLAKYSNGLKHQVEEITLDCTITEIEYWQPGRKSVAQLDPEWKVKTSCGRVYTLRYKVEPGDTIHIKILRFKR